jgi:hypothetical protein
VAKSDSAVPRRPRQRLQPQPPAVVVGTSAVGIIAPQANASPAPVPGRRLHRRHRGLTTNQVGQVSRRLCRSLPTNVRASARKNVSAFTLDSSVCIDRGEAARLGHLVMPSPPPKTTVSFRLPADLAVRLKSFLREQAAAPLYMQPHVFAAAAITRELDRLEDCVHRGVAADLSTEVEPESALSRRVSLSSNGKVR